MWQRFGSSLKTRIAAVAGVLFLAGIGLITLFVSRILHDEMQDMVSKQQLTSASYIARDIDGKLSLRLDSLKRVAGNIPPQLFADPPALQAWLDDRRAIHTLFPTGLMIIPPDGGPTLAETPRLQTRPKSFTDRDWFVGAKNTGQPFISKPLIARATNEPALVIAVPVFDQQHTLLAILAGVTPLATPGFLDLILGARPGNEGSYQLIAPQHRLFVLASESGSAVSSLPPPGIDPVLDQAGQSTTGIKILRNANNEEELAAFIAIPHAGWQLIARLPARDAFEPVTNTLKNTVLITALLSFPILTLLLVALHHLLQPISRLAGELHAMAEGSRPMHPIDSEHQDEVGDVANSFNRLQSKLIEQERRLAEMAQHDALTGLPNRLLITDRLENELRRIRRSGCGLALLFLDLDGFKPVNDEYGHQIGDLLLIEIARRLQATVRDVDTVARLGGDEFLILLSDTESPQIAGERIAHECLQSAAKPIVIGDLKITVGLSIGLATTEGRAAARVSAADLVSFADNAMYRAKANGRNRYAIYNNDEISPPVSQNA